jgi:hypothetical protein
MHPASLLRLLEHGDQELSDDQVAPGEEQVAPAST